MELVVHFLRSACRSMATFSRTPKIAVVGAGPAGLYVASGILRRCPSCSIDIFESNPVPYGLIRYGVAPDHPEMKNCINQFERMFVVDRKRISLYCNVSIGSDILFDELCSDYDAVVLAYGARKQRRLTIPGSDAINVFYGGDFVFWYNGVPKARSPLLDSTNAVIVGNGNVALDCCRILLSSDSDRLARSDIPLPILEHLTKSKVRKVTIIGRRGPLDVKFTIKELREQIKLSNCSFSMELLPTDHDLIMEKLNSLQRPRKRLTEFLLSNWNKDGRREKNHCELRFRRVPEQVIVDKEGRVSGLLVRNTVDNVKEELQCGLLICSLGYENSVLNGVPVDEDGKIMMLDALRVSAKTDALVYAAGWCAHQPRGVILNTQNDASNVAVRLCADLEKYGLKHGVCNGSEERLLSRDVAYISWDDWMRIDAKEKELGHQHGKEREKLLSFKEFIRA